MKRNTFFFIGILLSLFTLSGVAHAKVDELINYYDTKQHSTIETIEKSHLSNGIDKFKKGKFEFAWQEFASILHYIPNHPKALTLIGELSLQMEKANRATRYFERALQHYQDVKTIEIFAKFLYQNKQYDEAITQLSKAIAMDNNDAELYYLMALAHWANQEPDQAAAFADQAIAHGWNAQDKASELLEHGVMKKTMG